LDLRKLQEEAHSLSIEVIQFLTSIPREHNSRLAKHSYFYPANESYHPLLYILEIGNYLLYVSAEQLKVMSGILRNNFDSKEPTSLPIATFCILARIIIENSAVLVWVLEDDDENKLFQRGIALETNNRESLERFLKFFHIFTCGNFTFDDGSEHLDSVCKEQFDFVRTQKAKSEEFSRQKDYKVDLLPKMTSNQKNSKGLLSIFSSGELEIFYRHASGIIHGNAWAFLLNSTEGQVNNSSGEIYFPGIVNELNPEVLNAAFSFSSQLLKLAFGRYKALFIDEKFTI
jgi:Family of unknown function (DUF5677)